MKWQMHKSPFASSNYVWSGYSERHMGLLAFTSFCTCGRMNYAVILYQFTEVS